MTVIRLKTKENNFKKWKYSIYSIDKIIVEHWSKLMEDDFDSPLLKVN